jgi:hypothetical protein
MYGNRTKAGHFNLCSYSNLPACKIQSELLTVPLNKKQACINYILTLKLRHSEMGKVTINSRMDAAVAINSMQPIGSGSAGTITNKRLIILLIYGLFTTLLIFQIIYC